MFPVLKIYDGLQSLHNHLKGIDSGVGSPWVGRDMGMLVCKMVRIKISSRGGSGGWYIYWEPNKPPIKEEHKIKFPVVPINTKGFT